MDDIFKYYKTLGLKRRSATEEEIKQAYRDLVKVWHPDRFPNDPRLQQKAQEKLKEINLAYEYLKSHRYTPSSDDKHPYDEWKKHYQKAPAGEKKAGGENQTTTYTKTYKPGSFFSWRVSKWVWFLLGFALVKALVSYLNAP